MVSYRTRKTVLEILRDRGYEINDGDINQSIEDFKSDYESKPSQNFIAKRQVADGGIEGEEGATKTKMEPIFVVFATDVEKIGRETINKVITTMEQYTKMNEEDTQIKEFLNAILIVKGGITPIAKKVSIYFNVYKTRQIQYMDMCEPFMIETFMQEELLVNITHHDLVPKHTVLADAEKQNLLKKQ